MLILADSERASEGEEEDVPEYEENVERNSEKWHRRWACLKMSTRSSTTLCCPVANCRTGPTAHTEEHTQKEPAEWFLSTMSKSPGSAVHIMRTAPEPTWMADLCSWYDVFIWAAGSWPHLEYLSLTQFNLFSKIRATKVLITVYFITQLKTLSQHFHCWMGCSED